MKIRKLQPRRPVAARRPHAAPFPSRTGVVNVWVRGYGLINSPKMRAKPGQRLDLTAGPAPSAADAAHYYPAIYWYSLLTVRHQIAALIIRHDDAPELRGQFGGLGDDPDTGLATLRAGDDAADVRPMSPS